MNVRKRECVRDSKRERVYVCVKVCEREVRCERVRKGEKGRRIVKMIWCCLSHCFLLSLKVELIVGGTTNSSPLMMKQTKTRVRLKII